MNCSNIQELLPLYAGRDLEENRVQLVTEHLQACPACASLAVEYREARQLVQQFAPPSFSDEVYDGIRRGVWREIAREQEAVTPTLSQVIADLFRPRIRWAFATALLLAVVASAFYFVARRSTNRQQIAGAGSKLNGPTSPPVQPGDKPQPVSPDPNKVSVPDSVAGTHQPERRRRTAPAVARPGSVEVAVPSPRPMIARASPEENNVAEPDVFPALDPVTSEKPLRLELQTKDPNIRIIWFAHQPAKDSSNRSF